MPDFNEALIELKPEQQDRLAKLIMERFRHAEAARQHEFYQNKSIQQWLEEAQSRFLAQHDNQHFNLTRVKCGALHAKVKDMIVHSVDAPFVLQPTIRPELSPQQKQQLESRIERLLGEALIAAGVVVVDEEGNVFPAFESTMMPNGKLVPSVRDWLDERISEQKATLQSEAQSIAQTAAKQATEVMLDQMQEGKWRESYLNVLLDIFLYGTGVIRCERRQVHRLKWAHDALASSEEERLVWRHIPIQHCYPSPDSDDAQEGTYFIERGAMRKQDLFSATQIDWFSEARIREAYRHARHNHQWLNPQTPAASWGRDDWIDVLIHEGSIQGSELLDYLDEAHATIKPHLFYEAEVWVLAGVTIGVRLLEYPSASRSYFSAHFQNTGQGFWGIGTAMTLAALEDKINGLFVDLMRNLELSVSPPIFYNMARFDHPQDVSLSKHAKIPFNPEYSDRNEPPFYQPQFDSKSAELLNLINWLSRLADDESGVPSFLSGNSELMGGEATFRGMKMLAASSSVLIKSAFLNIDQTLIQPAMQFLWRWNMLHHEDAAIKADVNVVARGSFGLMQREIAEAEQIEMLPLLLNLLQSAPLPEESRAKVLHYITQQLMERSGMPVHELVQDYRVQNEQQSVAQSLQPATPMPTIGADKDTGGLDVT